MRARACLVLLLGLAVGCGSPEEMFAGELTLPVVYGTDDRVEVFNHPDADLRRIAEESIVALIPAFQIRREPDGTYSLFGETLGQARRLCADEAFANQPAIASCSGVLIDDQLVLTAGHCIDSLVTCDAYAYVFNYHLDAPNRLAAIRDEDVYTCTRVISQGTAQVGSHTPDYAIVELDRPVEGAHSPVPIRPAVPLDRHESLAMIGFGSGLPAKIDAGGAVANPRADQLDYFVANVDAFQGHSGSATFDSDNRLAGILIGGRTPDYVRLQGESCTRVSVYEDSQAAELVHYISPIVGALCAEPVGADWNADHLCDEKACEGEPCGVTPPPAAGPAPAPAEGSGAVSGGDSGCSASASSTDPMSGWLGLLLFVAARRVRRPAVRRPEGLRGRASWR